MLNQSNSSNFTGFSQTTESFVEVKSLDQPLPFLFYSFLKFSNCLIEFLIEHLK